MNESKDKIPEQIKPRHWDIAENVIQAICDAVSPTAQGNLIAAAFGLVFYGKEPSLKSEKERHIFRNIRADLIRQRTQILRRQREEEMKSRELEIKSNTAAESNENRSETAAESQRNRSEIASDTQTLNGKVVPPYNIINYKEIIKKNKDYFSVLRQNHKVDFKWWATNLGYTYPVGNKEESERIENELWLAFMFNGYNHSLSIQETKDRLRQASNLMECGIDKIEACEFVVFYLLQMGDGIITTKEENGVKKEVQRVIAITETELPKTLREKGYKDKLKNAKDKLNFLYNKLFRMGKNEG